MIEENAGQVARLYKFGRVQGAGQQLGIAARK